MKKLSVLLLLAIGMGSIMTQSCNKETGKIPNELKSLSNDEKMSLDITAFKERMVYYKLNPNFKSGGEEYTAEEAITELENLLNFNFCYTSLNCNQKVYVSSSLKMPLDDYLKINDPDLSHYYYNIIIDTIQAQMGRANLPNMKLLLVKIEFDGYDNNLDAIITIGSIIGNNEQIVLNTGNWWYGENGGDCNHSLTPDDAATQLDAAVTDAMTDIPGSGCHFYFLNPEFVKIPPTQDQLQLPIDNYLDYKIFYAIEDPSHNPPLYITDVERCVSNSEMGIYRELYIDYAIDFEVMTNKKFNYSIIAGNPYTDPNRIQHDYTIFVGNRFIECTAVIDNILEY